MKKIFHVTAAVVTLMNQIVAETHNTKIKRSVVLTPGYVERAFNSNAMMIHGPLGLMQLSTKGLDVVTKDVENVAGKIVMGALWAYAHEILAETSHTVYHEFGHARANASVGCSYEYKASSISDLTTDHAYGIYLKKLMHPWALFDGASNQSKGDVQLSMLPEKFFRRFINDSFLEKRSTHLQELWKKIDEINSVKFPLSLGPLALRLKEEREKLKAAREKSNPAPTDEEFIASLDPKKLMEKYLKGDALTDTEAIVLYGKFYDCLDYVAFGGLNNQMRMSQSVADLIYNSNGHLLYGFDYTIGKLSSYRYSVVFERANSNGNISSGNDILHILSSYVVRGYEINSSDIMQGSVISLLGSSTTWAFVYSAFTELPKGSFLVRPPVWHGWRLPDLNFYMTSQGLSYEVVTGYKINPNWYVGLSAEYVYKGKRAYEIGPSVTYTFPTSIGQFELSGQVIVSNEGEFAGNAGLNWTSENNPLSVGVHYIYHNALTLVGERNIPFLKSGIMNYGECSPTNHEINVTFSYNY